MWDSFSMDGNQDFEALNLRIKKFCADRDWSQFHDPKNLAISLNLEASEVLQLFQWTKDNQAKPERTAKIPEELADVLYWLIMLSNHYNVNLVEALNSKMDQNEIKYPIEKSKGKSSKYTEF
jgi:NTP pyrophosphatase (non-canonical NTP hydrolase)